MVLYLVDKIDLSIFMVLTLGHCLVQKGRCVSVFSADATQCVHVVTEMVTVMERGYTAHCDTFTWFAASVSKLFYYAQEKGNNYFMNRKNDNSLVSPSSIDTL